MTRIDNPKMGMTVPGNAFQQLISDCEDDQTRIQDRYEAHRTGRNAQYKAKIHSPDFQGWQADNILRKLHESTSGNGPAFEDPRNNLAFWARPPHHIKTLVAEIQEEIQSVTPSLWFTPSEGLHMTTFELATSRSSTEINELITHLENHEVITDIANYTLTHRTRLIKPMVSYDTTAIALSFVPAAGEDVAPGRDRTVNDAYTYHHLRRDICDRLTATGGQFNQRYSVPSAHITIARFMSQDGFQLDESGPDEAGVDRERVAALIERLETINGRLQREHWTKGTGAATEWAVGQEKGLQLQGGRTWYGEGQTLFTGKGIA